MYKRILVPVEGSQTSYCALQEAIHLAEDQHADLRIVHVVEEIYLPYTEGSVDIAGLRTIMYQQGQQIISACATLVRQAGLECESALLDAHGERAARVIVDDAEQWCADIIVMGTHGRHGFDHMIFGSVAEGVVRVSSLPVLLIKSRKDSGT